MANRACYKNTEFPLDLWCGTFSFNSKVTFFILIIIASQITKTSEQSKYPLIWFCVAYTYLFSLMRCCPYLPPLFLSVSFALPGILVFTSLSFALCLLLLRYKSSAASAAHPSFRMTSSSSAAIGRGEWQSVSPSLWRTGVLTLCALLQVSMQNRGRVFSNTYCRWQKELIKTD